MQKNLAFRRCKAAVNHPRVCKKKYQGLVDSLFLIIYLKRLVFTMLIHVFKQKYLSILKSEMLVCWFLKKVYYWYF